MMKRRAHAVFVVVVGLVVGLVIIGGGAAACTTARLGLPGTLRADVGEPQLEKVGTLRVETYELELFWGASAFTDMDAQKPRFAAEIAKQVKAAGGDGVAHMRYASAHDGCDSACMFATLGFAVPRTYRLTGDIVRIHALELPGKKPSAAPPTTIPPRPGGGDDDGDGVTPVRY